MNELRRGLAALVTVVLACACAAAQARQRRASSPAQRNVAATKPALNGLYRVDINSSDKLYTVVAGASSNLPFSEQQRFFIDLAVRLTPPDLLAIERRGRTVSIASSRAPRVSFEADGVTRFERASDGHTIRRRAAFEGEKLIFTARGRADDDFSVVLTPIDGGRRMRVTRSLSAEQLNEPVVIQTVYDRISDVAQWNMYEEAQTARAGDPEGGPAPVANPTPNWKSADADALRAALDEWVAATNTRDIDRQMDFYAPVLSAFYLARNVNRPFVRAEKEKVFLKADRVDVRAEAPEIIFRDRDSTAVMRFRKKYDIAGGGSRPRSGEVIQELRWRRSAGGWKIFSERDVRVIR